MKKKNNYFTQQVEDDIIEYLMSRDENLYALTIQPAIRDLAGIIINRFKFHQMDRHNYEELLNECESFLFIQMTKFKPGKGKAFSFFSIVCKNYLIQKYVKEKKHTIRSIVIEKLIDNPNEIIVESDGINVYTDVKDGNTLSERMLYIIQNLEKFIEKKIDSDNDKQIAYALLQILKNCNYVEFYNKKYVYFLIRIICNCETISITKVMKVIITEFKRISKEYDNM